jgi:predicted RND superfamily exporter protein
MNVPPGHPRRRSLQWAAVAALSAVSVAGITRLRIDDDLRSLLRDTTADLRVIDEVEATFGGPDRDCIVRATARSGDLFDAEPLAELRWLVGRLAQVDGVADVHSIFDVRREGIAGGLLPVIPQRRDGLDPETRAAAKARAARHPLVAGHLLSADGDSSLVLVRLADAESGPTTARPGPPLATVIKSLERALDEARTATPALELSLTGMPALREQAAQALKRDMLIFNGLGISLAVVLSALAAGSLRSTLVACVPPTVGAIWALGAVGLVGAPVNILTCIVPSLALVVGTCDSIHFIEDMRRSARRGIDPLAASSRAVRRVGTACGLTSLVTAVGFASLAVARIDAVRTFGIVAAIGALASFAAVTLLTPLLASSPFCSGLQLGRSNRTVGRFANALAAMSVRHARPLAVVAIAATLLLAVAGSGLDADNRVVDSLPRGAAASRALAGVDAEFGGAMGFDVVVGWPEEVDWRDGVVLASLDEVHEVLAEAGDISRAISLATVAAPLPDRARRRLDAEELRDFVAPESRLAVVRARVADLGSRRLERIYDRVDAGLDDLEESLPGWRFELAGMSVVSARNIRQLVRDLGSSLLLEVTVIGLILAVAFRSPLAGIVSLVPNIFPLAVIAAILVATGRSLDPATVIVFNVCLGLAVDDTVHVLAALQRNRREGISIATAVRRAVAETGNAVLLGGLVLAIGFATVTASSVPSLAGFGVLACAAVAAATVAELVLLPALVVVTDRLVRTWQPAFRDGIFGGFAWPAFDREPVRSPVTS